MKMTKRRKALRIVLSVLIIVLSLFFLQRLLVPKYVDDIIEGAFIKEFYGEENKDFNLIFLGDCEVYENFAPQILWDEYGISSYIRGSADQYIWQSYYLLEDTLLYTKPEAVVFNVLSMKFNESQSEAYNRMSLEGMEWSGVKVKAILASMKEDEHFLDYVFPILRYHSRWSELNSGDIQYMFDTKRVSNNGYYMRVDTRPAKDVPQGRPLNNYDFGDNAWKYLDMMRELCEKEDIELILIKAPSLYPYWYEEYEKQIDDYAEKYGLSYYNFLELGEETKIDYNTDTYDGGLHMNLKGAEKLTRYFGNILSQDIGLKNLRGDSELEKVWDENREEFESDKEAQYKLYGIKEGT